MKAIFRFVLVMAFIFGVAIVWKADHRKPIDSAVAQADKKKKGKEEDAMQLPFVQPFRTPLAEGWSKEKFQAELDEAFSNEDPCAVVGLLSQMNEAPPAQYWAAGMATLLGRLRHRNPLLEELFAFEDSPLYGKPAEASRNPETRFFNALIYAGLITPVDHTGKIERYRNYEKAIAELRDLAQADPENGAFSFYLAEALKRSGAKKEEVQSAFVQAGKASQFNTFYQSAYDALLSAAYDNAAAFTWVYSFLPVVAVPDFNTRSLKNWASDSDTGKWIAQKIAKKFIEIGSEYKQKSPGYSYSHLEYMIGQNLKYSLNKLAEKDREEFFKKMKEAQEFIAEQPKNVTDAEATIYMTMIDAHPSCSTESWKTLYEAYKQKTKDHG